MLGRLGENERVVPLAFHVDYFNEPWKDPFSDPLYSRREAQYSLLYDKANRVGKEDYLYFTPMVMVDGRFPLLGSGKEAAGRAREAIERALREAPEVLLRASLDGDAGSRRRTAKVEVRARSGRAGGRRVLIGVATYEDPIATDVEAGELKGKRYVGHYVVRKLAIETVEPGRSKPAEVRVPVELGEGWEPSRCGVVAFAQDGATGRVLQAARVPWEPAGPDDGAGKFRGEGRAARR